MNGQCYNRSIPQNLTFGMQGLPFGINLGNKKSAGGSMLARDGLLRALLSASAAALAVTLISTFTLV